MKSRIAFFLVLWMLMAACAEGRNPAPRPDVTLEPSQIAANQFVTLTPSPVVTDTPEAVIEATEEAATATEESMPAAEATSEPTQAVPTDIPQATSTSNAAELRALQDNQDLFITLRLEGTCFAAGDFIPFTLEVLNVSQNPVYFYKNGLWMLSINNSRLGPPLNIPEPQVREDFINLGPNRNFIQEEDDLGLWVQGMGPDSGIPLTPTGIGLPAGDYWVTFVYTNDKDGLTEQPDGTFLIDRAAWRGTTVTSERRFRVVEDVSECQ